MLAAGIAFFTKRYTLSVVMPKALLHQLALMAVCPTLSYSLTYRSQDASNPNHPALARLRLNMGIGFEGCLHFKCSNQIMGDFIQRPLGMVIQRCIHLNKYLQNKVITSMIYLQAVRTGGSKLPYGRG